MVFSVTTVTSGSDSSSSSSSVVVVVVVSTTVVVEMMVSVFLGLSWTTRISFLGSSGAFSTVRTTSVVKVVSVVLILVMSLALGTSFGLACSQKVTTWLTTLFVSMSSATLVVSVTVSPLEFTCCTTLLGCSLSTSQNSTTLPVWSLIFILTIYLLNWRSLFLPYVAMKRTKFPNRNCITFMRFCSLTFGCSLTSCCMAEFWSKLLGTLRALLTILSGFKLLVILMIFLPRYSICSD